MGNDHSRHHHHHEEKETRAEPQQPAAEAKGEPA